MLLRTQKCISTAILNKCIIIILRCHYLYQKIKMYDSRVVLREFSEIFGVVIDYLDLCMKHAQRTPHHEFCRN